MSEQEKKDLDVENPDDPEPEPKKEDKEDAGGDEEIGYVGLSEEQLPMVGMFMASIILLVAVLVTAVNTYGTLQKGTAWYGYAVSLPSVTMFCSMCGYFIVMKENLQDKRKYFAWFLALWTFAGALTMTFWGPFKTTGNGYFSAWAACLAGVLAVGVTAKEMLEAAKGMGYTLVYLVASIVVVIALTDGALEDGNPDRNQSIYGMVLACLTICAAGWALFKQRGGDELPKSMVWFIVWVCFALMWIVSASLLTFWGPFLVTGNGYFGSWVATVASVVVANMSRPEKEGAAKEKEGATKEKEGATKEKEEEVVADVEA